MNIMGDNMVGMMIMIHHHHVEFHESKNLGCFLGGRKDSHFFVCVPPAP